MGFPRSYANKISRSSQYQGRKRCGNRPGTNGWCFIFLKRFTRRVRAVSSAAHRTVKVRWIIHRVDRRWTRELTSSLGSRPHQHVNADRRENEKEEERKTTWKEKRRNREREKEPASRLCYLRECAYICSAKQFRFLYFSLSLSPSLFLFAACAIPDR